MSARLALSSGPLPSLLVTLSLFLFSAFAPSGNQRHHLELVRV